jgi:hypothetical protein
MTCKQDPEHVVSSPERCHRRRSRIRRRSADVGRGDPELREAQSNTAAEWKAVRSRQRGQISQQITGKGCASIRGVRFAKRAGARARGGRLSGYSAKSRS